VKEKDKREEKKKVKRRKRKRQYSSEISCFKLDAKLSVWHTQYKPKKKRKEKKKYIFLR
jgi:hypothetical protein